MLGKEVRSFIASSHKTFPSPVPLLGNGEREREKGREKLFGSATQKQTGFLAAAAAAASTAQSGPKHRHQHHHHHQQQEWLSPGSSISLFRFCRSRQLSTEIQFGLFLLCKVCVCFGKEEDACLSACLLESSNDPTSRSSLGFLGCLFFLPVFLMSFLRKKKKDFCS